MKTDFNDMVGKEIVKKSRKPFPSGKQVEVPIEIVVSSYTGKLSFKFENDERFVECQLCKLNKQIL